MKITITTELQVTEMELEDYLRVKFSRAKVGDIIRIKSKKKDKYDYLVLSKRNDYGESSHSYYGKSQRSYRTYHVVNLSTGYLWRAGGEDLTDSFTEWFTHNDSLTITELDVVDSSELTITSFK